MGASFQEQVAQLRRKQILDAATSVFAERGFHRTTIRDIAKAAGVADGTIYNYFENKTALLLGILDRLNESERRDADLGQAATSDIRQFFRQYFQQRWALFAGENLDVLRVVLSEVLIDPELRTLYLERVVAPTFALAEPYVQQLVAAGKLRPVDVALTLPNNRSDISWLIDVTAVGRNANARAIERYSRTADNIAARRFAAN